MSTYKPTINTYAQSEAAAEQAVAEHKEKLRSYHDGGFDLASYDAMAETYRVGCSQCSASMIQGVACHERGCPNEVKR